MVKVGGMKNPREINSRESFFVEGFAAGEKLTDESTGSQYIVVMMTQVGYLQSVSVKPQNPRNGIATTYEFEIRPNIELLNGDILYITHMTYMWINLRRLQLCHVDQFENAPKGAKDEVEQTRRAQSRSERPPTRS